MLLTPTSTSRTTQLVVRVGAPELEGDVRDADDFPSVHVDDLLVEEVADQAQQVFVLVVGREVVVADDDAVERDGGDLVVADHPPGPLAADQVPVDAFGVGERHDARVLDPADTAALLVSDLQAHQLGQEEQAFGHRGDPLAIRVGRVGEGRDREAGRPMIVARPSSLYHAKCRLEPGKWGDGRGCLGRQIS